MKVDAIYKNLKKRLSAIENKDPVKIQKAVESFKQSLKKHSNLRKVFNKILKFYDMQFTIFKAYMKINDLPIEFRKFFIDRNYKMALEVHNKIVNLKTLKAIAKSFMSLDTDFSPDIYKTVANYLAVQDTLLYISMDKSQRQKFLSGIEQGTKLLQKEVKKIRGIIKKAKQEVKQKIKNYQKHTSNKPEFDNVNEQVIFEGLFDPIKKVVFGFSKEIVQDLYTTYKLISTPMLKFKASIDKHIIARFDKLISKIAGGNPLAEMGLKMFVIPFLSKAFLGPYIGGFTMMYSILNGFMKIASLENMAINTAKQAYTVLDEFDKMFSEIEV